MPVNRNALLQQLDLKITTLTTKYSELQQRQQLYEAMKEENALLKQQLETLKTAKTLILGEKDVKRARQSLSQLIKQIDTAIALLVADSKQ